jgi:hypothetical protein
VTQGITIPTPFDDAIAEIERQPSSIHRDHALTVLRSKAVGYRQAKAEHSNPLMQTEALSREL